MTAHRPTLPTLRTLISSAMLLGFTTYLFCATNLAQASKDTFKILDNFPIRKILASNCVITKAGAAFFQTYSAPDHKTYLLTYGKTKDKPVFGCSIKTSAAGSLLDTQTYSEQLAAAQQESSDRSPDYLTNRFPSIGRRAMLEATGFGPAGGGFALTFTTHDGCIDIQVAQSGQLPSQAEENVNLHNIATALSQAYDQKTKHSNCKIPATTR